jgi:tricorn protease
VDGGIASAPEMGVYDITGNWVLLHHPTAAHNWVILHHPTVDSTTQQQVVENIGNVPDIVVDNLPSATFRGADAQLEAAVEVLLAQLIADPVATPVTPAYPDKAYHGEVDEAECPA